MSQVNNAQPKVRAAHSRTHTRKLCRDFETNVLGVVLSHEARSGAPCRPRAGHHQHHLSPYATGARLCSIYSGAKHSVEGSHQVGGARALKSGNSGEPVGPGPTDTGMLTRFTVTAENKAGAGVRVSARSARPLRRGRRCIVFSRSDEGRFITGHVLTSMADSLQ